MWFPSVCLLCLLVTLPNQTHALMKHQRMINHLAGVVVAATSFCHPIPALADSTSSAELVQQGMQRFRTADVSGSVQAFDDAIALRPGLSRLLWQRGLSLYYAERFSDCAKQFRDDIALNPQDAEEIVWTALCESRFRPGGFEEAANNMPALPMPERRPIMKAVLDLFQGRNSEARLQEVGSATGDDSADFFYSRLYLALWHEANGNSDQSTRYINDALHSGYARTSNDYMVSVAKVHAKLRSTSSPSPSPPPSVVSSSSRQ